MGLRTTHGHGLVYEALWRLLVTVRVLHGCVVGVCSGVVMLLHLLIMCRRSSILHVVLVIQIGTSTGTGSCISTVTTSS